MMLNIYSFHFIHLNLNPFLSVPADFVDLVRSVNGVLAGAHRGGEEQPGLACTAGLLFKRRAQLLEGNVHMTQYADQGNCA